MFKFKLGYSWLLGDEAAPHVDAPLFAVLYGILTTGSLQQAAREVGLSYRYAWGLMQRWERLFGQPLALLQRGRGARLTAFGEKLVWAEQRVRARLGPQLESLAGELEREFASLFDAATARLAIHASHDLALAGLRDLLAERDGLQLDLQFKGSVAAVASLAQGKCDLAGFHLADKQTEASLAEQAYRPWLRPRAHKLVALVSREQGLMVAKGNPHEVTVLADLTRPGIRFINRQSGSGSRLEFDQLLAQAGIDAHAIAGYQTEEFTHLAVAATIAAGMADAGFGIKAAAARYGLDFVALMQEKYFLLLRNESLDKAAVQSLRAMLAGADFQSLVARLPGYAAPQAGQVLNIRDALAW
jgi:putative molybdopterin biosynthesis protein